MKRFIIISFFLLVILVMVSCNNSLETNKNDLLNNGRVAGHVHGRVVDHHTGEPVNRAEIKYVLQGQVRVTRTNSDGYYAISNLSTGTYELSIRSSAYA